MEKGTLRRPVDKRFNGEPPEASMFTQVLVPLDRSPLAEQALGQAVAIARASHAALDVVLVHEPLPFAGFRDAPWNAEHLSDDQK